MPDMPRWRIFIIGASYVFYGWWNWHFVVLLAASTIVNQLFAVAIQRRRETRLAKWLLAGDVAFNLGVLTYFKYYDFFLSSTQNGLARAGIQISPHLLAVTLPVGISFFTFMALSYVIDVYRGDFERLREILES